MVDREDIAARALDALTPQERQRFDEGADAATLAELADMQETAAALGGAVAVEPPASLRASILARIADVEQEPVGAVDAEASSTVGPAPVLVPVPAPEEQREPAPALVGGGSTLAGPRELAARRRWFQRPGSMLAAAAAAVVLLVGGVAIGQGLRTPDPVSALVHASDVATQTESFADGTQATLLTSVERGEAALVFEGLASLDDQQVYEAWFMRDGVPVAAGIFEGGEGSVVHVLEGDMHEGDGVAITVEPEGGSEQPTSTPLVVMEA